MKQHYIEAVRLTERLHRQFLDVVKAELDRLGVDDLNSAQAMLLFHLKSEQPTVRELGTRGTLQGSNLSYNLRKLMRGGYVRQTVVPFDRRQVRVGLTPKGMAMADRVDAMIDLQVEALASQDWETRLGEANAALRKLESVWLLLRQR